MLSFVGAAAGPLALLQLKLMLVVGFVFFLCFFPCRDWVGVSTSYLAIRLCAKMWYSARLEVGRHA